MIEIVSSWAWFFTALAAFTAGVARGFSGFGAGLIFIPVASIFYAPAFAVPVLVIVDTVASLQLLPKAARICDKKQIAWMLAGAAIGAPINVWILAFIEADFMRMALSIFTLIILIPMATGWRYKGKLGHVSTVLTGGASGFLNGAIAVPGPPVILFWLAGQDAGDKVRANIIIFLAIMAGIVAVGLTYHGLFTKDVLVFSVTLIPVYVIATRVGAWLFPYVSERLFRMLALSLVAVIAIVSLFI